MKYLEIIGQSFGIRLVLTLAMPVLIFVTSIFLLVGCGTGVRGGKAEQGEFKAYVESFETVALEKGRDLRGISYTVAIHFGETKENEFAVCHISEMGEKEIVVNEEKWGIIEETKKEMVVYHELGHCILKRAHREDVKSLMNPYLVGQKDFEKNQDEYLTELFSNP